MKLWRRRENIKILKEGIKTLKRENNKILLWRRRGNKNEKGDG